MKLSHLITAAAVALTLSLPAFAANDADANMDAKSAKAHKMMHKSDSAMSKSDSAMNKSDSAMNKEDSAMNKDSSMQDEAMNKDMMININTADAATIAKAKLKGISMKKAEAIVAYREKNGNFQSIDDLAHVKGISKKIIAKNKDRLTAG